MTKMLQRTRNNKGRSPLRELDSNTTFCIDPETAPETSIFLLAMALANMALKAFPKNRFPFLLVFVPQLGEKKYTAILHF